MAAQKNEKRFHTLRTWLGRPGMVFFLAALAIVLTLPSLNVGFLMDDYSQQAKLLGNSQIVSNDASLFGQFSFLSGDPKQNQLFMDIGMLPWWTFKGLKLTFWRPLTEISHWVDYRLWPDNPLLMHLQSILWFALLVVVLALLYRQIIGPTWVAGLAALLFTIDHTHSLPVSWLANRNVIIAAFFGALTLLAHDKWQKNDWRPGMLLASLCFILSLLAGESGVSICAYIFSYAVFIDKNNFTGKCRTLLPYSIIALAWWTLYHYFGFGATGSGMYIDPARETGAFLRSLFYRLPILLQGQFGILPAQIYGIVPESQEQLMWVANLVFLVIAGQVFYPLLRRDAMSRFWTLGMFLSLIPVCATIPDNRLLMFASIGAAGLLAQFFNAVWEKADWLVSIRYFRIPVKIVAGLFLLIHLMISPFVLTLNTWMLAGKIGQRLNNPLTEIKLDPDTSQGMAAVFRKQAYMSITKGINLKLAKEDLILVNPPMALFASYLPSIRLSKGMILAHRTRVLASGIFPVKIKRVDDKTLEIQPVQGFMANGFDKIYRGDRYPMQVGQKVELPGMTAKVLSLTKDFRPKRTAFRFEVPLEDPSLKWMCWDSDKSRFVDFDLPGIGQSLVLGGAKYFF